MLKILIVLFTLLNVTYSESSSPVVPKMCGTSTFACPSQASCCRGPGGWRCCPGVNATCCSDGASCCPANSVCDLRNRRCNPKNQLAFLSYEEKQIKADNEPSKTESTGTISEVISCIDKTIKDFPLAQKAAAAISGDIKDKKELELIYKSVLKAIAVAKGMYENCKDIIKKSVDVAKQLRKDLDFSDMQYMDLSEIGDIVDAMGRGK